MKTIIRAAESKDVETIRTMIAEMLRDVRASEEHKKFELQRCSPAAIKKALDNILIAVCEEKPIGFLWFDCSAGVLKIKKIYVSPPFRRQKIASTLVEKAITIAREKGCHKIFAVTRASNSTAISFFRKLGFTQEGCLKKHYFGVEYILWARYV